MKYMELKIFSMLTCTVRSLYRVGQLTTVVSSIYQYQLNIAAILETRWPVQGNLKQIIAPTLTVVVWIIKQALALK